jgi:hypothetical protein
VLDMDRCTTLELLFVPEFYIGTYRYVSTISIYLLTFLSQYILVPLLTSISVLLNFRLKHWEEVIIFVFFVTTADEKYED